MSEHIVSKKIYFTIFGALMVFTALTVMVAFIDLGAMNLPVAIAIAVVKATLVFLYFMHVKYGSRLVKIGIVAAIFTLMIMFSITLSDYMTRYWTSYIP
jgi:cytochrome c oxidase subunit IV